MSNEYLQRLLDAYQKAPEEYQATSYWSAYEKDILNIASNIDFNYIRSGKYPKLSTFGFNDDVFNHRFYFWKRVVLKILNIKQRQTTPYSLQIKDIQNMAYHHCQLVSNLNQAKPISDISASSYGNSNGLFQINNNQYTIPFLNYYLRYCFAHKHLLFKGNEILVELGSGSGYQIEVLKKIYPDMTILCFDLPAQAYLCENYMSGVLGHKNIITTEQTLNWTDLSAVQKGKIHFFPNWMLPLLKNFKFDIFWNAASFGEMEPSVVENYLSYIKGRAKWVYLLQMKQGQKTTGKAHVKKQINFEDYKKMLEEYDLVEAQDVYSSISKISGDYFEGVWKMRD